jgi:hypothetical protein
VFGRPSRSGGPSRRLLRPRLSARTRRESSVVTEHDVVVGYACGCSRWPGNLGNVSRACRLMASPRSTDYRLEKWSRGWRRSTCASAGAVGARSDRAAPRAVDRGRRAGSPGVWPRRISAELAREKWGGLRISEHGGRRALVRLGLTRAPAPGLGRASPRSPRSRPSPRPASREGPPGERHSRSRLR